MIGLNVGTRGHHALDLRNELVPQFFLPRPPVLQQNVEVSLDLLQLAQTRNYMVMWDETVYSAGDDILFGLCDQPCIVGGAAPDHALVFPNPETGDVPASWRKMGQGQGISGKL